MSGGGRGLARERVADHPGDDLLRPLVLVAIGALLLNDHLLKSVSPGPLTGKLSDVAGLLATPFVVRALIEIALARSRTWSGHSARVLVAAALAIGTGFATIKLVPIAAAAFGLTLAWAQRLPLIVAALGAPDVPGALATLGPIRPAPVALDPTDLLALPALAVAVLLGGAGHRVARPGGPTWARLHGRRLVGGASALATLTLAASLAGCSVTEPATPPPPSGAMSQAAVARAVVAWVGIEEHLPSAIYVATTVREELVGFSDSTAGDAEEIARSGEPQFGSQLTADAQEAIRSILEPDHDARFVPNAEAARQPADSESVFCPGYVDGGALLSLSAPRPLSVDGADGFLVAVSLDRGCEGSGWLLELAWDGVQLTVTRLLNGFSWVA